jgi:hypothetical protein
MSSGRVKRANDLRSYNLSMRSNARHTFATRILAAWNSLLYSNWILMAPATGLRSLPLRGSGCIAASSSSFTRMARPTVRRSRWSLGSARWKTGFVSHQLPTLLRTASAGGDVLWRILGMTSRSDGERIPRSKRDFCDGRRQTTHR